MCAAKHPTTGKPIFLKSYVHGYFKAPSFLKVEEYNTKLGITKGMVEAMLCGSIFGFEVPGADPAHYNDDGTPKKSIRKPPILPEFYTT